MHKDFLAVFVLASKLLWGDATCQSAKLQVEGPRLSASFTSLNSKSQVRLCPRIWPQTRPKISRNGTSRYFTAILFVTFCTLGALVDLSPAHGDARVRHDAGGREKNHHRTRDGEMWFHQLPKSEAATERFAPPVTWKNPPLGI